MCSEQCTIFIIQKLALQMFYEAENVFNTSVRSQDYTQDVLVRNTGNIILFASKKTAGHLKLVLEVTETTAQQFQICLISVCLRLCSLPFLNDLYTLWKCCWMKLRVEEHRESPQLLRLSGDCCLAHGALLRHLFEACFSHWLRHEGNQHLMFCYNLSVPRYTRQHSCVL